MPDLNNLPSESVSTPKLNGFRNGENRNGIQPLDNPTPPHPTPIAMGRSEGEGLKLPISPDALPRGHSLRMQLRYLRTLSFAAWLFARLIFWHLLMPRVIGSERVKRGSLRRWTAYARQFRAYAISMGGVMIKLGQFVSTRVDALPPEIIQELAGLQDEVPSVPNDQIMAALEAELGPVNQRFEWIADTTVAAASLGQVYRAKLLSGERVVVKVQRPGIRQIVYTDLAALTVIAKVANRFRFISRRMDTVALAHEFGRVLLQELSYIQEAQNAARFAQMFKPDLGIYIPAVYPEHSTDSVITIEDVTSIKITDVEALKAAGIDPNRVAKRLMDAYLKMIFEERFFHADPHPGNLFVYPLPSNNGQSAQSGRPFYLIFIDFGMTGSLTPQIANGLINTITAVINRDVKKLVDSYQKLGFIMPDADMERIQEATQTVFDQVWGLSMTEISSISYGEMRQLGHEFNDLLYAMPVQVPQDFIYLGRAMGILSGMAISLDPNFNPWDEIQPYAQKLLAISLKNGNQPGGSSNSLNLPTLQSLFSGNAPQMLAELARTLLNRAVMTPQQFEHVLGQLDRGELTVRVTPTVTFRKHLNRIETQGRRTTRAVIFGSLLISSTLLYTNGDILPAVIGYVFSGLMLLSVLFSGE